MKKNIRAQHLDKKNIHSRETLKKKTDAARKSPAPPITFLMVRPLNALKQKILFTSPLASFPIISFLSSVQLLARMNLLLYQPLKRKKKQTKNRQLRISRAPQTFQ